MFADGELEDELKMLRARAKAATQTQLSILSCQ